MTQMPRREGEILINGQRHFAWFANGEYHCEPCMTPDEFKLRLQDGLQKILDQRRKDEGTN